MSRRDVCDLEVDFSHLKSICVCIYDQARLRTQFAGFYGIISLHIPSWWGEAPLVCVFFCITHPSPTWKTYILCGCPEGAFEIVFVLYLHWSTELKGPQRMSVQDFVWNWMRCSYSFIWELSTSVSSVPIKHWGRWIFWWVHYACMELFMAESTPQRLWGMCKRAQYRKEVKHQRNIIMMSK